MLLLARIGSLLFFECPHPIAHSEEFSLKRSWKQAFFHRTRQTFLLISGVVTASLTPSPSLRGQSFLPIDLDLSPIQSLFQTDVSKGPDLARKPPMGWSIVVPEPACELSEATVKEIVQEIAKTGLDRFGFQYIVLENCWHTFREGKLVPEPIRFPKGLRSLADELHEKGFKLGLNVPLGSCQNHMGQQLGHGSATLSAAGTAPAHRLEASALPLAATLVDGGVDFIRMSPLKACEDPPEVRLAQYQAFSQALKTYDKVPQPLLSLNDPGVLGPQAWSQKIAPLWTLGDQPANEWPGILEQSKASGRFAAFSGSGHWNEPGPLWPPQVLTTLDQKKTQWSLWALLGAPLLIRYDINHLDKLHRNIITNSRILALYHDALGLQGFPSLQTDRYGVWIKPMAQSGQRVIAIINKTSTDQTIKLDPLDWGLDGPLKIRDLWEDEPLSPPFQWQLPPFGSAMVVVMGKERPMEAGDILLSERTPVYAAGLGSTVGLDQPMPLISGIRYSRGLLVQAPSVIRYFVGRQCQRFQTLVGLDDSSPKGSLLGFEVWGDGHLLARSKNITSSRRINPIDIKIEGIHYLDLAVQSGESGFTHTSGSWVHPLLTCRGPGKSESR